MPNSRYGTRQVYAEVTSDALGMNSHLKAPVKRTGTPVQLSPHPKAVISVEEWEAKASLTDKELRSVSNVQKALGSKPLPLKSSDDNGPSGSRAGTPVPRFKARFTSSTIPSRSTTPDISVGQQRVHPSHPLLPSHPVQTPQQFFDWFSQIERSVAHSQEAQYRAHLASVSSHLDTCDSLLSQVDQVQSDVNNMMEGWRTVEMGGKSLNDASEVLLDERDSLIRLSEDIGARLEYFQELEHATRMLNHPGESLVLQDDFLDMVERVDICIDFLNNHRHYREAETYLLRFRQCLTRAMTLIKMYFIGSLRALMVDISRRISDKEVSQTATMHLLYTRFQSVSSQLSPLLGELEGRTRSHPEELTSLLAECHTAYFTARRSLLSGRIAEEIKGLNPGSADLVELTRSGCSYLKQLCIDEFAIYRCFFNSGKDQLYQYLESLCDYLYDDLRPRILHEARLIVICDVCKVLQALMVLDAPDTVESDEDEDEDGGPGRANGRNLPGDSHELGRLHIGQMLRSILQDAQTRLFFKAQNVVQSDIRYYVPKPEDIDYPRILMNAPKSIHIDSKEAQEDSDPLLRLSSLSKRRTLYPTVKTTITVLSQLHEFVQPSIFGDIAQESLDLCRLSLLSTSSLISARDLPATEMDGQLFLVRHLLVLKEMSNTLNLVDRDSNGPIELHHVTNTLKDMLRTSNFMPYAFTSSLASNEIQATSTKDRIDDDLRCACEHIIVLCSAAATLPIRSFMISLNGSSSLTSPKDNKSAIPSLCDPTQMASSSSTRPSRMSKDIAIKVDNDLRTQVLPMELPSAVSRLRLYLEEESGTVNVLLSHIQDKIVDEYISFRKAAEFMPLMDERQRFEMNLDEFRSFIKTLC